METSPQLHAFLAEHRAEFLAFAQRRAASEADAQDAVQVAFEKAFEKIASLKSPDSARAWFYRILRNVLVDQRRKQGAQARAVTRLAEEPPEDLSTPSRTLCRCVSRAAQELKPAYAAVLSRVDVEGASMRSFAEEAGISPGNAAVRAFRARAALRREVEATCGACADDGCADCTCTPA